MSTQIGNICIAALIMEYPSGEGGNGHKGKRLDLPSFLPMSYHTRACKNLSCALFI